MRYWYFVLNLIMDSKFQDEQKAETQVSGNALAATSENFQNEADADRIAFLSSFSPEEDKRIRRKVDWRFLWLIGMMYIIKNVS